jgi:hypothetical protein
MVGTLCTGPLFAGDDPAAYHHDTHHEARASHDESARCHRGTGHDDAAGFWHCIHPDGSNLSCDECHAEPQSHCQHFPRYFDPRKDCRSSGGSYPRQFHGVEHPNG